MSLPPKKMLIENYTGLHMAKGGAIKAPVAGLSGAELAKGGDNIPATIHDQQGNPVAPASIKQGEIVFSVEAVIGAGNGDYHKGAQFLLALHEKLQEKGEKLLAKQ